MTGMYLARYLFTFVHSVFPVSNYEKAPLTSDLLDKFRSDFYECPKNVVAQNACSRLDVLEVCTSRERLQNVSHNFTHKVELDAKPVTNQKSSGRCWIFACLNVMRLPIMKQYNLEEFQFSQSYLFFWDKVRPFF
ncbi:bleomycin hydrolase [Diaphorina citri]|uniref:Bleomycin hydrolase n=1 Tax=Diaphorina citri TaxID=121845 RepID=A0A3Q0JDD7_DIACI|nr:bleomycin hydrolase [Diaphorina citri]